MLSKVCLDLKYNVVTTGPSQLRNGYFTLLEMDNFHIKQPVLCRIIVQFQLHLTTLRADASFCLLDWWEKKGALTELLHTFKVATAQTSGLINLVLSWQMVFSKCEDQCIDKLIQVITEPVEPSTRPLGLGLKTTLYIPATCNACASQKSYSIHAESFSSTPKSSNKQKKGSSCRRQTSLILMLTTC